MKKTFQFILAGVIVSLAGCSGVKSAIQQDEERFCNISCALDSGGSCYFIGSPAHLKERTAQLCRSAEKSLWKMNIPDDRKRHVQSIITGLELFFEVSGLNELSGWGGSSKLIEKNKNIFRNRLLLLAIDSQQGFLWDIAKRDPGLMHQIGSLPADTSYAAAANLDLKNIATFIKHVPNLQKNLDRFSRFFTGMSSCDLLERLSGVWLAAIITDKDHSFATWHGIHLKLHVPSPPNSGIFDRLAVLGSAVDKSGVDLKNGTVQLLPIPGLAMAPIIIRNNSSLTFFSSPEAWYRFNNHSGRKLADSTQFRSRKARLTDAPAAVFYRKKLPGQNSGGLLRPAPEALFSLGTVEKRSNGFLFESLSDSDWNEYIADTANLFPVTSLAGISAPPPKNVQTPPQAVANTAKNKKTHSGVSAADSEKRCLAHLKTLSVILQKNVQKLNGNGIQVMRKLVKDKVIKPGSLCCPTGKIRKASPGENLSYANCAYLFLGVPPEKSPKSPMLLELPFNHKSHAGIIYADGSCSLLKIPSVTNVRRCISILHTRYIYEEQEFFRLMKLAEDFDKILEL